LNAGHEGKLWGGLWKSWFGLIRGGGLEISRRCKRYEQKEAVFT